MLAPKMFCVTWASLRSQLLCSHRELTFFLKPGTISKLESLKFKDSLGLSMPSRQGYCLKKA